MTLCLNKLGAVHTDPGFRYYGCLINGKKYLVEKKQ